MNTAARILSIHAWFALTGISYVTPSSGTVSRAVKPPADAADATPLDVWFNLGIIESGDTEAGPGNVVEIWKPNPGKNVLYQEIETKPQMKIMLTCKEGHALFYQALYGTLALSLDPTATAIQFNPMEGKFILEGWLKTQAYDSNDVLVESCDVYGGIRVSASFGRNGENVDYSLEHKVWHSDYNTDRKSVV